MCPNALRPTQSRREALRSFANGFGYLAFVSLAGHRAHAQPGNSPSTRPPHFAPKAKRVIFLCMNGAPSHVDLLDPKPALTAAHGQTSPHSGSKNQRLMASPWKFQPRGRSGTPFSELLPYIGAHADEICVVRSMHTDNPAHGPASLQLHTGNARSPRPSLGAWTLYGLGSESQNLPGFITLSPPTANGGAQKFSNAFLPAIHQGTPIGLLGPFGKPLGNLQLQNTANPHLSKAQQRAQLDLLHSLNQNQLARDVANPSVEALIESFELAFRMQSEADLFNLEAETEATRQRYGIGSEPTDFMGRQCLLARRLAEAGVRFIEVNHGDWDDHRGLSEELPKHCREIDRPVAALLEDLRERGLLQDTLVLWGGEFGRTPHAQGNGRDHNAKGFSFWMAGGGIRGGMTYGATDELGYEAIENPVSIADWHATILHLLGLDHEHLTYRHAGREFRLTDLKGRVVRELLA